MICMVHSLASQPIPLGSGSARLYTWSMHFSCTLELLSSYGELSRVTNTRSRPPSTQTGEATYHSDFYNSYPFPIKRSSIQVNNIISFGFWVYFLSCFCWYSSDSLSSEHACFAWSLQPQSNRACSRTRYEAVPLSRFLDFHFLLRVLINLSRASWSLKCSLV